MPHNSSTPALPDGWSIRSLNTLGPRSRFGNEIHGKRPHIRAVPGPGTTARSSLLVANEVGDLRVFFEGPAVDASQCIHVEDPPSRDGWIRFGNGCFPTPDHYRYTAAIPAGPNGAWDLLYIQDLFSQAVHCPWCSAQPPRFGRRQIIGALRGIPDAVDWKRDSVYDLLLGTHDGRLVRVPRDRAASTPKFGPAEEPVIGAEMPITGVGPLCPCVVDWDGAGRSDLLIADGAGKVWLYRDIGDDTAVRYDRGRQLVTADGFLAVSGPASATVLETPAGRQLLVADGDGAIWSWPMQNTTAYVTTDLAAALGGIADGYARGQWWKLQDSQGPLVAAAPQTTPTKPKDRNDPLRFDPPAPELALTLPVAGVHEIHVTLRRPVSPDAVANQPQALHLAKCPPPQIVARLTDQPIGEILIGGEMHFGDRHQLFFKTADLTGRKLHLSQLQGGFDWEGGVPAYIESILLVPVPPPKAQPRAEAPAVGGIFDARDWNYRYAADTEKDIDDVVARHQTAGMNVLYYKLGGAAWEYPSQVPAAESVAPTLPSFTPADTQYAARMKASDERINRVKITIEGCHRRGMQCMAWIRLQNYGEHIHGKFSVAKFYFDHPEYLEKDIHGYPLQGKLCIGYDEVRAHHVAIVEEVMRWGAHGIMIDTLRHLPKVMYGDPIVESFQRKHGLDMRTLLPTDVRVVDHQVEVMTGFLREVRQAMHAIDPKAPLHVRVGKPYPLMGCDPGRWAREGLIDAVLLEDRSRDQEPDVAGLMQALRGTSCTPGVTFSRTNWGGEHMPLSPARIAEQTDKYKAAGVRLVAFYETCDVFVHPEFSRAIRRIRDAGELPSLIN